MDMSLTPFHLAFPVHDLETARSFYGTVLGCPEGRSAPEWIDFDLFGHQIVAHVKQGMTAAPSGASNPVDGHDVPIPHFGGGAADGALGGAGGAAALGGHAVCD